MPEALKPIDPGQIEIAWTKIEVDKDLDATTPGAFVAVELAARAMVRLTGTLVNHLRCERSETAQCYVYRYYLMVVARDGEAPFKRHLAEQHAAALRYAAGRMRKSAQHFDRRHAPRFAADELRSLATALEDEAAEHLAKAGVIE